MRFVLYLNCVYMICFLAACKKNSTELPPDGKNIDSLNQSVIYKTVATVPSPADSAKGLFRDSVSIFRSIRKTDPDFLTNIPNVNANIWSRHTGFSFGYDDDSKSLPYFSFTSDAFPDVPREFQLNKIYEHTSIPGSINQHPLFLGSHNGFDGMTYFINNVFPPDADYPPLSKTYTKVTFTRKMKIPYPQNPWDSALLASGHIAGYCITYYNKTDTAKYVHRWDFTVDFTDLKIDE